MDENLFPGFSSPTNQSDPSFITMQETTRSKSFVLIRQYDIDVYYRHATQIHVVLMVEDGANMIRILFQRFCQPSILQLLQWDASALVCASDKSIL